MEFVWAEKKVAMKEFEQVERTGFQGVDEKGAWMEWLMVARMAAEMALL